MKKVPYICGALTELPPDMQTWVKTFYSQLGDVCREELGERAFVPHEHFDPVKHAEFTPQDVDRAERHQVCGCTSLLIVVAIEPSWGGGIEVEMANRSNVPVLVLRPKGKRISRLLLGNPSVVAVYEYENVEDVLSWLRTILKDNLAGGKDYIRPSA